METRTYNSTYVALLDVLGFKDLADNNEHAELVDIYEKLSSVINDSLSLYQFNKIETDSGFTLERDMSRTRINSMTVSDSLILWTDDTNALAFYDLIITVRYILFHSMHIGIPLRGGISLGPLSVINRKQNSNADNQQITYIGKSIIDAYGIEQVQEWSGCAIQPECLTQYEKELPLYAAETSDPARTLRALSVDSLTNRGFICKYDVPMKENKTTNGMVINWPSVTNNMRLPEQSVRNSFARHNKSVNKKNVPIIIQNTIDFLNAAPWAQTINNS